MNTPWISCRGPGRARRPGTRMLMVLSCLSLCGCTYSGGQLLYMLGFGRGQKVEAKFRLTDGPVMILIAYSSVIRSL